MNESAKPESARILVVDDDANARTISATWLEHAGYDVRDASSAQIYYSIIEMFPGGLIRKFDEIPAP